MRSAVKHMQVAEFTIRRVVQKNLSYKLYVMRKGSLWHLLNKLKHCEELDILWFLSDEKTFHQDQKLKRRSDR